MRTLIPRDPIQKRLALSRYSERVEIPMLVVSIIFIAVYSWEIISQPTGTPLVVAEAFTFITWVMFVIDFIITIALTDRKKWFTLTNLIHLAIVALPMFRALRILRAVSLLQVMNKSTALVFRNNITAFVVSAAALLTYLGSLAVLDAERDAEGASITSLVDALWWAFITITTVGYGDYYPVTGAGRLVGVFLTLAGIFLMGVIIASAGIWVYNHRQKVVADELADEETDELKLTLNVINREKEEKQAELDALAERERGILEAIEARKALTVEVEIPDADKPKDQSLVS